MNRFRSEEEKEEEEVQAEVRSVSSSQAKLFTPHIVPSDEYKCQRSVDLLSAV